MNIKREIVEIDGLKTYFFPTLLFNIIGNKEAIIQCSKDVNPVAAFIMDISPNPPTNEQLSDIITAQNEDVEKIHASMDTLFALERNQATKYKELGLKLRANGGNHDLFELESEKGPNFQTDFAALVRKATIQRKPDAVILSFLHKLRFFKSDVFDVIYALMQADLCWDAFVFSKLDVISISDEDFEGIRTTTLELLKGAHPDLSNFMREGPKKDDNGQFVELIEEPISKVFETATALIVSRFSAAVAENGEKLLEEVSSTTDRFFYLVVRTLISNEQKLTAFIYDQTPEDFRRHVFSGLEHSVFEGATSLAQFFIGVFETAIIKTNALSFNHEQFVRSGLYSHLANQWEKEALARLLYKIKLSVSQHSERPLYPEVNHSKDRIFEAVVNGLEFALWVVENYGNETKTSAISRLHFVDTNLKQSVVSCLKVNANAKELVREHFSRIEEAINKLPSDKPEGSVLGTKPISSTTSHVTYGCMQALDAVPLKTEMQYSKEKIQAIHEITPASKNVQEQVMKGIDETDSSSLIQLESKSIGGGVTVSAFTQKPVEPLSLKPVSVIEVSSLSERAESPIVKSLKSVVEDDTLSSDGWGTPKKTSTETDNASNDENTQKFSLQSPNDTSFSQGVTSGFGTLRSQENIIAARGDLLTFDAGQAQQPTAENAQKLNIEQPQQFIHGDTLNSTAYLAQLIGNVQQVGSGESKKFGSGGNQHIESPDTSIYDEPPSITFRSPGGFARASLGFTKAAKVPTGAPGANGFGGGGGGGYGGGRGGYRGQSGAPYRGNSGSFGQSRGRGGDRGGGRF